VIKIRSGGQENLDNLTIIALPPRTKLCFSSKSIFFNMHANYSNTKKTRTRESKALWGCQEASKNICKINGNSCWFLGTKYI
jgi:hypothetical protein